MIDLVSLSHFLIAIFTYLLGSLPSGLIITKLAGLGDIRQFGSGNIGATNVLRTGNKGLALLTLLLDSSKGAVATWIVMQVWSFEYGLIAGFCAVLGHNFPIWLKFKGGKGVATTLGVLFVASWQVGVLACASWILVAGVFRYSSLASLVALAAAPVFAEYFATRPVTIVATSLAALAFIRHQNNIRHLVLGQENKIGQKKPGTP